MPLLVLESGDEGTDRLTLACLEKEKSFVTACIVEFGNHMPRAATWRKALAKTDYNHNGKLANSAGAAAREEWYRYEADKIHCLLDYSLRIVKKNCATKSVALHVLRERFRTSLESPTKSAPSTLPSLSDPFSSTTAPLPSNDWLGPSFLCVAPHATEAAFFEGDLAETQSQHDMLELS